MTFSDPTRAGQGDAATARPSSQGDAATARPSSQGDAATARPSSQGDAATARPSSQGDAATARPSSQGDAAPAPAYSKDEKNLFLNVTIGIVLLELAVTVGAVVFSIANAERIAPGAVRFHFPWIGYLVAVTLVPVLVMLVLHLVSLGFSRTLRGEQSSPDAEAVLGSRAAKFYALVRGAPTVILFAGFVLMGAAIYYLDGVMALLLKLGDSFQTVAIWSVGALGVAFCVNAVARAVLAYKTRQLEEEYAFRREVFERTGTILLSNKQVALSSPTMQQVALPSSSLQQTALPSQTTVQGTQGTSVQEAEIVDIVEENSSK